MNMEDRIEKYSSMLIEPEWNNEDDEQALNERTLKDASQHLMDSLAKMDILFRAMEELRLLGNTTLILGGPILSSLHDVHDLAVKAANTVEYLREQEA